MTDVTTQKIERLRAVEREIMDLDETVTYRRGQAGGLLFALIAGLVAWAATWTSYGLGAQPWPYGLLPWALVAATVVLQHGTTHRLARLDRLVTEREALVAEIRADLLVGAHDAVN